MVGWRRRKTKLTARPHLAERREGGGRLERHESKGKMYFRNYAIDTRVGWDRGRVGRKVGRA
jgi:hypothetical protein